MEMMKKKYAQTEGAAQLETDQEESDKKRRKGRIRGRGECVRHFKDKGGDSGKGSNGGQITGKGIKQPGRNREKLVPKIEQKCGSTVSRN